MPARDEGSKQSCSNKSVLKVGSRVAAEEICKYAIENGMDVLLVQEPHTHKGRVTGLGTRVKIDQTRDTLGGGCDIQGGLHRGPP